MSADGVTLRALRDVSDAVRLKALAHCTSLPLNLLTQQGSVLTTIHKLSSDDPNNTVRTAAARVLRRLAPYDASTSATDDQASISSCVERLGHSDAAIREAALDHLSIHHPSVLAKHARAVLPLLRDPDWGVRQAALALLGGLDDVNLSQHGAGILSALSAGDWRIHVQTHGND